MADILIHMEIPEYCYECPCHNGESGYCQAYKSGYLDSIERPAKCPLGSLPEGHAEWIPVKERLPENKPEKCLCYSEKGDFMVGAYTNWGWMFPCYFGKVTHWMPLPEPPKEGGGEDG